jgi:hypothetical protein
MEIVKIFSKKTLYFQLEDIYPQLPNDGPGLDKKTAGEGAPQGE